ncbi:hypothetical protein SAMN04487886_11659 [Clostridium sp. DSM 8431]|uniref:hypothetical protein n=1 Tax=Clostridium sp. DSM 8431 TaxID=1761781 RepID=UPI0008E0A2B8|nr:hypothetical protein [Clostridium sp. DSM 8431]SFU79245.1 hypothetical protein SAMN04487886_11659 [Clostridium sp. DSM 8431]
MGEDISEPKSEENSISLKVIEVWKDRYDYRKFTIIREEDSSFKIDDIIRCEKFTFN